MIYSSKPYYENNSSKDKNEPPQHTDDSSKSQPTLATDDSRYVTWCILYINKYNDVLE